MSGKLEYLRSRVRFLGSLLAEEEAAQMHLANWRSRRSEHDGLLEKLYRLEKRTYVASPVTSKEGVILHSTSLSYSRL